MFEETFSHLKRYTGKQDIEDVVLEFKKHEDLNQNYQAQINILNSEPEELDDVVYKLQEEFNKIKYSQIKVHRMNNSNDEDDDDGYVEAIKI